MDNLISNSYISILLASTVISTFITLIGNLFLRSREFRFNYKKYILDQRILSYEACKKLINELMIFYTIDTPGQKSKKSRIHGAFYITKDNELNTKLDSPTYTICLKMADLISEYKGWLSNEMVHSLDAIHKKLSNCYSLQSNEEKLTTEFMDKQGTEQFAELHAYVLKAHDRFFIDIKSLDNIRKFKSKKRNYDSVTAPTV